MPSVSLTSLIFHVVTSVVVFLFMMSLMVVDDVDGLSGWLGSRPWSEFSATILIMPGNKECFYHDVDVGNAIQFEYQLYGKNRHASLNARVTGPNRINVYDNENSIMGQFSHNVDSAGAYEFCLINNQQKYFVKYVQFYLSVMDKEKLISYYKAEHEIDVAVGNMSGTMRTLDMAVRVMRRMQLRSRVWENRDMELLEANKAYVTTWSGLQCLVIVCAASIQVYALRSLFRTAKYTPTQKPRC